MRSFGPLSSPRRPPGADGGSSRSRSWALVLPSMFVAVWMGFALLPETHPVFRWPASVGLALFVGVGSQLAGSLGRRRVDLLGTQWVVPSGAVLALVGWLSSLPERSFLLAPLGAGLVLALVGLQTLELTSSEPLRGAAHATNIAAGFALAFGAYLLASWTPVPGALALSFLASAAVALVVLRGNQELRGDGLTYAAVIALGVAELAGLLYGTRVSPLLVSAVLVLALYATSGICHAILDRASRHAYVEVATVTALSLSAVVIAGGRT